MSTGAAAALALVAAAALVASAALLNPLVLWLSPVLVGLFFVWRSFYSMRISTLIPSAAGASGKGASPRPAKDPVAA